MKTRPSLLLFSFCLKYNSQTSGQDGGIGRHALPHCTTIMNTTNLKIKNTKNCQKITQNCAEF